MDVSFLDVDEARSTDAETIILVAASVLRLVCEVFTGSCKRVGVWLESATVCHVLTTNEIAAPSDANGNASALALLGRVLETWHRRMGHVNFKTLKWMAENKVFKGLVIKPGPKPRCALCVLLRRPWNGLHPQNDQAAMKWLPA